MNAITFRWGAYKNIDNPICDIIVENGLTSEAFKYFDKYKYSNFYCHLFAPIRESVENILEIGVDTGGSLFLWRKYFPNVKKVIGIENNVGAPVFGNDILGEDEIADIFTMDAYCDESFKVIDNWLLDQLILGFDVIIDDGPHTVESWKYFMDNYDLLLPKEGIAIIEDVTQKSICELSGYNEDYVAFGGDPCREYGGRFEILPKELEFETKDCLLINDKRRR